MTGPRGATGPNVAPIVGTAGTAGISATTATFTAKTGGATVSIAGPASGTQVVLVVLTTDCSNLTSNDGCYMSFSGNNGSLLSGAAITGSLTYAAGGQRVDSSPYDGSAMFAVTIGTGTTTFTANYADAAGGTATFATSTINIIK